MKSKNLSTVVLYGICAALWTAMSIRDFVTKVYTDSIPTFVLHTGCAVLFIIAFAVQFKKSRADKDE